MLNVLSILPEIRFTKSGVKFPAELKIHYEDVRQVDDIIEACRGMDFLFLPAAYPPITANVLEHIPSVRMIQSAGAGYDQVDIASAAALGIPVANSPGHNTGTVAELTIAMIIALMPAGAILVNTARGELIEPLALADALENSHIAGAALDTLAPEPPTANHPLLNLSPRANERLLLTPHIAGTTQGAFHRMLSGALKKLADGCSRWTTPTCSQRCNQSALAGSDSMTAMFVIKTIFT
jgi:phosphoglycerate dehydrogenase-like enzyme